MGTLGGRIRKINERYRTLNLLYHVTNKKKYMKRNGYTVRSNYRFYNNEDNIYIHDIYVTHILMSI